MPAINIHFEGVPGPEPVKYLGVFDDAGNPLNIEEWREIASGTWTLRVVCEAIDSEIAHWNEGIIALALRIWRTQAPGYSLSTKISNVLQSIRGRSL